MARTRIEILKDIEETQLDIQGCERQVQWIETSGNEYIKPGDSLKKQQELAKYKSRLQALMREEQEAIKSGM
jgi:hypothetical protein